MKTSSTELIKTEKYLTCKLDAPERLLFEARLLLDNNLRTNTFIHRMVHRMVLLHARKKLRTEAEAVHERLFNGPGNRSLREIKKLFNR